MACNQGLSKCCISGTLHEGTPTGTVETINGLETYVSRPENGSAANSIVFLTDSMSISLTEILDYEAVKRPLAMAMGEKDGMLDMETVERIKEALEKRDAPTEVRVYGDQVHGFTIRGDWSSEKDQEAMDDSLKQGIAWFDKYLA
jgi:hypothetical protein